MLFRSLTLKFRLWTGERRQRRPAAGVLVPGACACACAELQGAEQVCDAGVWVRLQAGNRSSSVRACVRTGPAAMDVAAMDLGRGQNGAHGNRSEGEEGLEDAAHLGEADGGRDGLGDDGGEQPDLEKIGGWRAPHGRT